MLSLQYSLCNEPLIELSNPGASGSIFYVTRDDEFIIKTVNAKEAEFLQKLLPGYYMVSMSQAPPSFQFMHVCVCDGHILAPGVNLCSAMTPVGTAMG